MSACKLVEVVVALASNAAYSIKTKRNLDDPIRLRVKHVRVSRYPDTAITLIRSNRHRSLRCLSTYSLWKENWVLVTHIQINVTQALKKDERPAKLSISVLGFEHLSDEVVFCMDLIQFELVGRRCGFSLSSTLKVAYCKLPDCRFIPS